MFYICIISNVFSDVNTLSKNNRTNFLNICLLFAGHCAMIKYINCQKIIIGPKSSGKG